VSQDALDRDPSRRLDLQDTAYQVFCLCRAVSATPTLRVGQIKLTVAQPFWLFVFALADQTLHDVLVIIVKGKTATEQSIENDSQRPDVGLCMQVSAVSDYAGLETHLHRNTFCPEAFPD
jgi:hypothetical protein